MNPSGDTWTLPFIDPLEAEGKTAIYLAVSGRPELARWKIGLSDQPWSQRDIHYARGQLLVIVCCYWTHDPAEETRHHHATRQWTLAKDEARDREVRKLDSHAMEYIRNAYLTEPDIEWGPGWDRDRLFGYLGRVLHYESVIAAHQLRVAHRRLVSGDIP